MKPSLDGLHILVVEDEYLAAMDVRQLVEALGGTVVGPVGRLEQALALLDAEPIDGAVLDVQLDNETSYPLADALAARRVPILFATGYDLPDLPERFAGAARIAKPVSQPAFERAAGQVFVIR